MGTPGREHFRVHCVMPEKALPKRRRTVIGVVEEVILRGPSSEAKVLARIDTGAERTTIDMDLAKAAGLGPVLQRVKVRAAAAEKPEERDVMEATLIIAGKEFGVHAAIADRKEMRYPGIAGMDILRRSGFRVDPGRVRGAEPRPEA